MSNPYHLPESIPGHDAYKLRSPYEDDDADDDRYVECPSCNEKIWVDARGRTEEGKLPLCPGAKCFLCENCCSFYRQYTGCEEEFD